MPKALKDPEIRFSWIGSKTLVTKVKFSLYQAYEDDSWLQPSTIQFGSTLR